MLEGLPYGHSVDWWALGIMVFKMLTGHQPYNYGGGGDDDMMTTNTMLKLMTMVWTGGWW